MTTPALVALPAVAGARPLEDPSPGSAVPATPSPPSTVVRDPSGYTLSIALAGAALVVAILSSGYIVIRIRGPQRRTLGPG